MCRKEVFTLISQQRYAGVLYIHYNKGGATDTQSVNTVVMC